MKFAPFRTRPFLPPKDDILGELDRLSGRIKEGDILFVTSKVLAIHQGRCVPEAHTTKLELIKKEADRLVEDPVTAAGSQVYLTIKQGVLIPSAGIDESNAQGYYILWPSAPSQWAKRIWQRIRKNRRIKHLGVIITDSHTTPLRKGTMGIAIGCFGIEPVRDYRGRQDIFGRKLRYTQTNLADALAAAAVLVMGEGNECQPFAVARGAPVRFTDRAAYGRLAIDPKMDIYRELLKPFHEQKET